MIIQNSTKTSHLAKNISSIKALPISSMQNCLHKIIKFRKVSPMFLSLFEGKWGKGNFSGNYCHNISRLYNIAQMCQ